MHNSRDITLNGSPTDRTALVIGPLVILVLIVVMAGWNGPVPHAGLDALIVLSGSLPWVALWLGAAIGLGWPLRCWLAPASRDPLVLQTALGIAAMLSMTAAAGRLGLLQFGGSLGAWVLIALGIGLAAGQLARHMRAHPRRQFTAPPWLIWTASPAVAVLLLASTSAPGGLWDSEFGGYDAMSYHLQLPKQWLDIGAIIPLQHNVYSFLPGYVEGAFYHLAVLRGDAHAAVYACQLLHGVLAVVTAMIVGAAVRRWTGDTLGSITAAVLLIGTPWVVVVGSLAYNEMATTIMLAGGLMAYFDRELTPARRGAVMGILAAAACGAKLTAVGFVAAPLGIALLARAPARAWPRAIATGSLAGVIVLGPYFIGNATATSNPVFPFATSIFGSGHWDQQQVEIWRDGHASSGVVTERLEQAWHQLMRYGIGTQPDPAEPWHAQWSLLPWLALVSLALILIIPRHLGVSTALRRPVLLLGGMIAVQFLFWITLTHIKSRFMLPMVVPAAAIIAIAVTIILTRWRHVPVLPIALAIGLTSWCCVAVYLFSQQAGGRPAARIAMVDTLSGAALSSADRELLAEHSPVMFINHRLGHESHVLLVGEAAPLYYTGNYTYQTTWDRGPLSHAMQQHGEQPQAWIDALREAGYTHMLVNDSMLLRWENAGWNDPLLTADRVIDAADRYAKLVQRWDTGERLYRLD